MREAEALDGVPRDASAPCHTVRVPDVRHIGEAVISLRADADGFRGAHARTIHPATEHAPGRRPGAATLRQVGVSAGGLATHYRRLRAHLADPLFRNGYALMLNTGIAAPLGLVFWGLAARLYPAADVGRASAAFAAMVLLAGFTAQSLIGVLTRFIPQWGRRTGPTVARVYVYTSLATVAITIPFLLTIGHWGPSLDFLAGWVPGLLFTCCTVAWGIFTLQDGVLTGLRSAVWVPAENTLFNVAKIILLLALAATLPYTGIEISWMLPVFVLVPLLSLLIFARLIPRHKELTADRQPVSARRIRQFLAGDYLGRASGLVFSNLVPVVVAARVSASLNAYFYMAWIIGITLSLLAGNMAQSLTVEGAFDEATLASNCQAALRRTMLILCPVAGGIVIFAPQALSLFGASYAANGAPVLELLVAATLPKALIEMYLGALRAQNRAALIAVIPILSGVAELGLAVALIGRMGIVGAGVAVLASQVVGAAAVAPSLWRVMSGARTLRVELAPGGDARQ